MGIAKASARLLLDTHTFLWWVQGAEQLSKAACLAIQKETSECFLSVASVWEIASKVSIGKLALSGTVETFITHQCHLNNIRLLPIEFRHAARIEALPKHHTDPFDRLLISQALEESLVIVSKDPAFKAYQAEVLW